MHASTIRPLQLRPVYRPLVDGDDELINHVVFLGYPMFRQTNPFEKFLVFTSRLMTLATGSDVPRLPLAVAPSCAQAMMDCDSSWKE